MRAELFLTLVMALALKALSGQTPAVAPGEQPFRLTATAELVLLDVSVKDAVGGHISNLKADNFRIYENGNLQAISHFGSEDVPVTIGLVMDTSGSMRLKQAEVIAAALAFIQASNRQDEVFVVNFSDVVKSGLPESIPFSSDIGQLRAALSDGTPEGRTALYDAILFSLSHLEKGTRDRKTLVLVSDGGDNNSVHGSEDMVRMVRESRATIYTIGIYDESDRDQNPGLLRHVAQVSGGEAFFPQQLSEVDGICKEIANDIRARYTIGYVPVRLSDKGSLRKVRVAASKSGRGKLVVHTRTTYLLPDRRPLVVPRDDLNRKPGS
jgi:VWFA-related protein